MASPSMVQRSGDTLIIRSVVSGNRLFVEGNDSKDNNDIEPQPDDIASRRFDEKDLPDCKVKRNYMCNDCKFFTNNPRHYLAHLREIHNERFKSYDCPHCVYATKRGKSLLRHLKVSHESLYKSDYSLAVSRADQFVSEDNTEEKEIEDENEDYEFLGPLGVVDNAQTCSVCSFVAKSSEELTAHERKEHTSTKFFPCSKCNYVTHIKARFTKHVKYHSMPMIKCNLCDFATPYKWNLDRHMRNHGGTGSFCCSTCNFTADIKQSLTVHEMNHHTPPVGNGTTAILKRKYRQSDLHSSLRRQLNIEPVSRITEPEEPPAKSPKADDLATLQILTQGSCSAPISVQEHLQPQNEEDAFNIPKKKIAKPIPNLIPLQETPVKKDKKKLESFFDKLQERLLTATADNETLVCKLCGFVSKCLSEYSVHEKNCNIQPNKLIPYASLVRSTRCQNCRHRCKSSADLIIHMQNCAVPVDNSSLSEDNKSQNTENESEDMDNQPNPHPMENVVFVWNPMSQLSLPQTAEVNDVNNAVEATDLSVKSFDPEASSQSDLIGDGEANDTVAGKKAFKCPHCPFWASTASRFHVHIVGHLNKKPFECSLCPYRSNWRWDITKHIRLKTIRDPAHADAKVLMTDETGRRNYSKYNKYLRLLNGGDNSQENNLSTDGEDQPNISNPQETDNTENDLVKKQKKTLWKCKKCNYKNQSKILLLIHVREHNKVQVETDEVKTKDGDASGIAFRCGHCNQLSNWKHVIQRHCRLKHNGVINVLPVDKPFTAKHVNTYTFSEITSDGKCTYCPYTTSVKPDLEQHLQKHTPNANSIFKCFFCPYFVDTESDLIGHLPLHGIANPIEYIAKTMNQGTAANHDKPSACKRYKCTECPYDSNSKSQYIYHKQFHRLPSNTPYKCQKCNYSVTKRHLLHQHMRVHRLSAQNNETSMEETAPRAKVPYHIPHVWVSVQNEFHKMFKCRYCAYVNALKTRIHIHEKIHTVMNGEKISYKCYDCHFVGEDKSSLVSHTKIHDGIYGKIHCLVDPYLPDQAQIQKLVSLLAPPAEAKSKSDPEKRMHFCRSCPARFLTEQGWKVHTKFHQMRLPYQCPICSYTARQQNHLESHRNVHMEYYQTRTKELEETYGVHPDYKQPKVVMVVSGMNVSEPVCIVVNEDMKKDAEAKVGMRSDEVQYACNECPATFSKLQALNNHKQNHGGNGEFKCKKCSYAVKTNIYLVRHEALHEPNAASVTTISIEESSVENEIKSQSETLVTRPNDHFPPVLQADPQFGYLMHGNPEFIYPTYIKNGRQKEKRYKCHKCPSAFEKREQYKVHLSLHGSKQRYKCEGCDYSVKYYANYVQHMRKHQMNAEAQAAKNRNSSEDPAPIDVALSPKPKCIEKRTASIVEQQREKILRKQSFNINNFKDQYNADKKVHTCFNCPFTSPRREGLESHAKRHLLSLPANTDNCLCPHCDFVATQPYLLKEHLKIHFGPQKPFQPCGYMKVENIAFTVKRLEGGDNGCNEKISLCSKQINRSNLQMNCNRKYVLPLTGEIVDLMLS